MQPQVLLWTTCLLSSCAAASARPEDAGYIIRETVRAVACFVEHDPSLKGPLSFKYLASYRASIVELKMASTANIAFLSLLKCGQRSQDGQGESLTALYSGCSMIFLLCLFLQENLKHTLPSDSYDLIPDTSLDLRVGYEAQQIDWLCFQRILQASLPEYLQDRPATLSSLLVGCRNLPDVFC